MDIDKTTQDKMIEQAKKSYQNAYAPYSKFHVGASILTSHNDIVSGCNVENASYGLTICAERNCIAQAINQGEQRFEMLVIYTQEEKLTPPCGACRQVILEFFKPDAMVMAVNHHNDSKVWSVADLLPDAFTTQHLT
ncbi:cytidine deaminase [Colwelliaceae bacterium 6441]